ncbi:MAG: hypothetical protein ACI9GM_000247 [Salibacteraceae bacterium]|jgi:hypothetical protein
MKTNPSVQTLCLFFLPAVLFSFAGCHSIFQAVAFPNQCKKCRVIYCETEIFQVEGCGASNVRIEEQAKIAAFDLSRGNSLGNYTVSCTTWKQEPIAP